MNAPAWSLWLYAAAIFLGAFLLFQVQPLIGKYVLPWFGGSAGVWAASLLFFQVFLLIGYAYAHALATWLRPRGQALVHLLLLALVLVTLPIIPSDALRPEGSDDPVWGIVVLLTASVGAPYLLLAANGPLLQHWFAAQHAGRSPYRLYALSNAASLIALLSYPLWFERAFELDRQAWLWSGGYVLFALLCGALAVGRLRARGGSAAAAAMPAAGDAGARSASLSVEGEPEAPAAMVAGPKDAGPAEEPPDEWWRLALWIALPAVASALLLSTTTHLTQDIAPVPLLWVLPLSVYLLTFILTFESDRWYYRPIYVPILMALLTLTALNLAGLTLTLVQQVSLLLATLYFAAMTCHGELVALRPGRRRLTLFYLAVSAGGALGGALVALGAPAVFDGYWEFHLSLVAAGLVGVPALVRQWRGATGRPRRLGYALAAGLAASALIFISDALWEQVNAQRSGHALITRNFYGALRVNVIDAQDPERHRLELVHGQTLHGIQFQAPERRAWHTTYYSEDSGIGLALTQHPSRLAGQPLRIGLIGLGTGTLASFAERGDYARFYEINPEVLELATERFTYLGDARERGADIDVLLGDARLVLERQLERGEAQRFDVLAVDAFSSDSIPIHLLTREAFALYRQHMAPGGILAVHVSNRYLDLAPVVRALAAEEGLEAHFVANNDAPDRGVTRSEWVLVTDNGDFLSHERVRAAIEPWPEDAREPVPWTDSYSALLPLLRF